MEKWASTSQEKAANKEMDEIETPLIGIPKMSQDWDDDGPGQMKWRNQKSIRS